MKDRTIFLFSLCCCAQLCLTLCGLMDCSPPGSSVLGIFQARMLKWGNASSPGDLPDSEGTGLMRIESPSLVSPLPDSLPLAPSGKPYFLFIK